MAESDGPDEADELTGLTSMTAFYSRVSAMLSGMDAQGERLAIVYFDVENFKEFNHLYGFEDGNGFLRSVAHALEEEFPDGVVARFTADEFAVCTRAHEIVAHIIRAHERVHAYQRKMVLELKAGIYIVEDGEDDVSECCDCAKLACDSAKGHFDEVWVMYDRAFDDKVQRRQYVVNNLDEAIANGWIEAFYQPIMRVSTGELCGMEALARWKDPVRGYLQPAEFIDTLERLHLIARLDIAMIERVCERLHEELAAGRPVVPISLNLSRLDFELVDIVGTLVRLADGHGVPHDLIDVEITESALTGDKKLLHNELRKLRQAGFRLWMDDFGSGYSSLNSYKDLGHDFDLIKFDMDFLRDFENHPESKVIMSSIVNMARRLGTLTLAEGVETDKQFRFLDLIGCDKAQGYLFGKPMPYEDLVARAGERGWGIETAVDRACLESSLAVADDGADEPEPKVALKPHAALGPAALWSAVSQLCPQGLFWKDDQRRFVDVNQAFLRYYGLSSVREVRGRTDEDMGWHIDADPYRNDELRVLEEGVEVRRSRGLCICHGEIRNICASKVPIFENGKVVGLLGFFEDETDELRQRIDPEAAERSLTGGVLDMRNFEMLLETYEAGYQRYKLDFAYVDLRVSDRYGYDNIYGAGYASQVTTKVIHDLRDLLGNSGIVHHQSGSSITVVKQVENPAAAGTLVSDLRSCIGAIRQVDGTECTVDADCGAACYSEAGSLPRLTQLAAERLNAEQGRRS